MLSFVSVRLSLAAAVAALTSLLLVSAAHGALILVFSAESGPPGTEVTGRSGGEGPFTTATGPVQTFLVRGAEAVNVTKPDDPRLMAIGQLEVDADGNGTIAFTVPDVEAGAYAVMVHCPACAEFSAGRSMLSVAEFEVTSEFACPVTLPNRSQAPPEGGRQGPGSRATHGNGLLWTVLPGDGVWVVPESGVRSDGSLVQKFVWWRRVVERTTAPDGVVTTTYAGDLRISGRRLDRVAPPLSALTDPQGVHVGSIITFPTSGCWEITGAAGEDALTFTVYMLAPGEPVPNTATSRPFSLWAAMGLIFLLGAAALALIRQAGSRPY